MAPNSMAKDALLQQRYAHAINSSLVNPHLILSFISVSWTLHIG